MFSNVLVGVDGRPGGRDPIALAKQLAEPGGRITLAHISGGDLVFRSGAALVFGGGREDSGQLLTSQRQNTSLDAELMTYAASSVGRGLHEVAERSKADLLVIGSCHRGLLGRVFLSDDTCSSLNGAPCAIAIAPSGYAARSRALAKLGVGCDGSPVSERALAAVRELAARHGSAISAPSVVSLQSILYGEPVRDLCPEVVKELIDDDLRSLHGFEDVDGDVLWRAERGACPVRGEPRLADRRLPWLRTLGAALQRQHLELPRAPREVRTTRFAARWFARRAAGRAREQSRAVGASAFVMWQAELLT